MRKIQKTFSLEPMTSRMPSVLPAYKDNVLYYFDDASLKERDYVYPSNYGMIPLNLRLSGVTFSGEVLSATSGWSAVTLDSEQCFCNESSEEGPHIRPCNAMIPNELSGICDYTKEEIIKHGQYNDLCSFTLSFERLSKWYYFFKEYYHLLNDYGHCNRTYSSATEYYKYESGTRYADQMIYGTDEQTYIDLDNDFTSRGGIVNVSASGATDIGFYKWVCDNIVPSYYISKDYVDYWRRTKLYYPDVIKWIAWFSTRLMYEEMDDVYTSAITNDEGEVVEREHWDCKGSGVTDCCDCEEYFNRGGKREYDRMIEWYLSLQSGISEINDAISSNTECFIPTMDDKIQLHNSLDDLGQYTIFSKEYELGIDYRTASYGDTANTHGGTVAEVSGNTMILEDGRDGFCFSHFYMDKVYDNDAWENYTAKYIGDSMCPICGYYGHIDGSCPNCGYSGEGIIRNRNEFVADGYNFYAYDNDNVMYTGATSGEVISAMSSAYTYDIINTDAILIDGVLYDVQRSEYGEYDITNQYISGKTFFVYRDKETSTPYTLINGKKVYAEWYPYPNPEFDNQPCYYFTFFRTDTKNKGIDCGKLDDSFNITNYKPFGRKASTEDDDLIDYISYMGQIFQVSGNSLVISGETVQFEGEEPQTITTEYPRVSGYAYSDTNDLMYCISGTVVDSELLEEIPSSSTVGNQIVIGLDYHPPIYKSKELSGHTVSRLTDLECTDVLIDDIGNKIDGRYNPSNENIFNHQPPQGSELDLLYEVGNTSNIRRFKLTYEDVDEIEDINVPNYFVGNIITNMVFYYKDKDGNAVELIDKDGNIITTVFKWEDSSLKTIKKSQDSRTKIENGIYSFDGIYYYTKEEARDAASIVYLDVPREKLDEYINTITVLFDGDDIYCDITYYVGATLSRKQGEPFKLAYSADVTTNNYNYGVEYKETVKFVKENREYYLKKMIGKQIPTTFNSPSAHSISYPIYVYKMTQEMSDIEGDEYNTYFESPLAAFRTEINTISGNLSTNFSGYTDMDAYNNIHVAPVFKPEYMLGISSLENIDSDIYIERGINAAFEKHLKLGEVTSLEALEQYSNGYFKIIDN